MKDKITGFLFCLLLFSLCAFVPLANRHEIPSSIDSEFENIYLYAQSKNFRIEMSSVALNNIKENEIILMKTGDLKFVTRHNNRRYFVKLTEF